MKAASSSVRGRRTRRGVSRTLMDRLAESGTMTTVIAMSSPDASPVAASDPRADGLVAVGVYPTFASGSEHGLVVLAMGRPYWLMPAGDGFALMVESPGEAEVRGQLARFDRESIGWPPAPIEPDAMRGVDLFTPTIWALVVTSVFSWQQRQPQIGSAGALDTMALFSGGEWWRLGTALFLHADAAHLVSNAVSGVFVFAAVLSAFGRSRGWQLVALAALAGNLASAALRHAEPYSSIGASTAIFGGLGLLTGRAIQVAHDSTHPHRWRSMFVAFAAGLTVLALYGAGGHRVDLGAHLCGFAAGLAAGFAVKPKEWRTARMPSG
ncbi:MAG: rhomboid family intramembrane serine protease [Opitutus sp.]|nr:rhomboid family intramembrane serine protease [Opitutus sp.]